MTNTRLTWPLFLILSLAWGSTYLLMKKSMFPLHNREMVMGPFQVGALRIFLASVVLMPVAFKYLNRLNRRTLRWLVVTGMSGSLLPALLFTLAQSRIDSSLASLMDMTASFFVVIIGALFYKAMPSRRQLAGLAFGATGLYLILQGQAAAEGSRNLWYALLLFPANLGYAVSFTTIKFRLKHLPAPAVASLSYLMVFLPSLAVCIVFDAFTPIIREPAGLKAFGYLSILAIGCTATGMLIFTKLVSISSHIFASGVVYTLPLVAIIFGVMDGEKFAFINLVWMLAILAGVYLMNNTTKKEIKI